MPSARCLWSRHCTGVKQDIALAAQLQYSPFRRNAGENGVNVWSWRRVTTRRLSGLACAGSATVAIKGRLTARGEGMGAAKNKTGKVGMSRLCLQGQTRGRFFTTHMHTVIAGTVSAIPSLRPQDSVPRGANRQRAHVLPGNHHSWNSPPAGGLHCTNFTAQQKQNPASQSLRKLMSQLALATLGGRSRPTMSSRLVTGKLGLQSEITSKARFLLGPPINSCLTELEQCPHGFKSTRKTAQTYCAASPHPSVVSFQLRRSVISPRPLKRFHLHPGGHYRGIRSSSARPCAWSLHA